MKITNISPFQRLVTENDYYIGEISRTYVELRPWLYALIGSAIVSFCIWSWIVTEVGAIEVRALI